MIPRVKFLYQPRDLITGFNIFHPKGGVFFKILRTLAGQ